jgi:hypothetical protein
MNAVEQLADDFWLQHLEALRYARVLEWQAERSSNVVENILVYVVLELASVFEK